ncbi:MAG: type II secretion system protein [Hominimerdicola sp.]
MKKNKQGFTLVELIVVVAIMTIIMGAVLSILKPVNNYFIKVKNTAHQEAACIAVGDSISDYIKYAKKIKIVCTDDDTAKPTGYKHVITIDNNEPRNSVGATGLARHCCGLITTEDTAGSNRILRAFDINNDASYCITVEEYGTATTNKNFIKLNFQAMALKYEGGAYVNNTDSIYRYSKSIEFTNINNKDLLVDNIKNDCNFSFEPYNGSNSYPKYIFIAYDNPDET